MKILLLFCLSLIPSALCGQIIGKPISVLEEEFGPGRKVGGTPQKVIWAFSKPSRMYSATVEEGRITHFSYSEFFGLSDGIGKAIEKDTGVKLPRNRMEFEEVRDFLWRSCRTWREFMTSKEDDGNLLIGWANPHNEFALMTRSPDGFYDHVGITSLPGGNTYEQARNLVGHSTFANAQVLVPMSALEYWLGPPDLVDGENKNIHRWAFDHITITVQMLHDHCEAVWWENRIGPFSPMEVQDILQENERGKEWVRDVSKDKPTWSTLLKIRDLEIQAIAVLTEPDKFTIKTETYWATLKQE